MRKTSVATALGAGLLGVLAIAGAAQARNAELIQLRMQSTPYNAGRVGMAVVSPSRDQTGINLTLSGVPDQITRPVHLYTYLIQGSCESRDAASAVALRGPALAESVVSPTAIGAYRGPVRLSYRVPRPFEEFTTRPFALSVRLGPADGGQEIFCGEKLG